MKKILLIFLTMILLSCEGLEDFDCGCYQVKKTNTLINNIYPDPWLEIERKRLNGECYDLQVGLQTSFMYIGNKTIKTNIECDSWL